MSRWEGEEGAEQEETEEKGWHRGFIWTSSSLVSEREEEMET